MKEKEEIERQWRPLVTRKATTKNKKRKIEAKGRWRSRRSQKAIGIDVISAPFCFFLLPCDALFRRPVPSGRARRFVQESTRPNPIKMFRLFFFCVRLIFSGSCTTCSNSSSSSSSCMMVRNLLAHQPSGNAFVIKNSCECCVNGSLNLT